MSATKARLAALSVAALLFAVPVPAAPPPDRADYEQLSERLLTAARPLPAGGVQWAIDTASFMLENGSYRLQEAVHGISTGLWFEGRGSLSLAVPDRFELQQLRRLLRAPDLSRLELDFDRLLLRASGGPPIARLHSTDEGTTGPGTTLAGYEERHDRYYRLRRFDVEARLLAALATPGALYWQADLRTEQHGWVTVTYDSQRTEELSVEHFDRGFDFLESWLSLDRSDQRTADGRPTGALTPPFDVGHVDIQADLRTPSRKFPGAIDAVLTAHLELETISDGLAALPLRLARSAEVTAVSDGHGRPLEYVRDHLGARSSAIDNEIYDDSLLVLLPAALAAGSSVTLSIDYQLRLPKYGPGRGWYPGGRDGGGLHDRHTARFEMTTDDRHTLQAMGELIEQREGEKSRTTVWRLEEPAKMVTFAMQKKSYSHEIARDGLPRITTVGDLRSERQGVNSQRIDDVADDVADAIDYFQQLLDAPLPERHFFAALIYATHGQAFPGFLHLGDFTTLIGSPAAVERFRAHEVAHQWWGHGVGWHSYRDQWLSEGFAEYLALMFMQQSAKGGDRLFNEAITAYGDEIKGSISSTFSTFARPGFSLLNARGVERMGPIGHGWRASVGETPNAYLSLAYYKGALVLHMLRTTSRLMTESDEAFTAILRDFVSTHRGRAATTDDFRAAVERVVPGDWSWFFEQWVYGTELPTYSWQQRITAADGGFKLKITVEQSNVSAGFKMMVPVEIDFGKGDSRELALFIDQPTKTFEFSLAARPRKVIFNPGDAILAKVKKR